MRFDAHTHIGPAKSDLGVDELIAKMDELGTNVVCAYPYSGLRGDPDVMAANNDYIAAAMTRYPDRIMGFCSVNPWYGREALAELERCLGDLGLKGLKLHPPAMGFDVANRELVHPVMEIVARYNVPVTIHCGLRVQDNPWRVALLADDFPGVTIIMAHSNFGGSDYEGVKFAARRPNIMCETSGTPQPSFIAELCELTGGTRVAFGSDWPALVPEVELKKIECCPVSDEVRARILGRNMAGLFGLG